MEIVDIFGCLQRDHRAVESLFEAISLREKTDPRAVAEEYRLLREELRIHGLAEEEVLYPFLQRESDTGRLATEAMGEHDKIDDLLEELDTLVPTDDAWHVRFERLWSVVSQHVAREEGEIFPYLRRTFPEGEVLALCPRFEEARSRARAFLKAA